MKKAFKLMAIAMLGLGLTVACGEPAEGDNTDAIIPEETTDVATVEEDTDPVIAEEPVAEEPVKKTPSKKKDETKKAEKVDASKATLNTNNEGGASFGKKK